MTRTAVRRWVIAALSATVLAASGTVAASQTQRPAPRETVDAPEAVAYLTTTYGISTEEAQRRLVLQRHADALLERLYTAQSDSYAGAWLDQDHGGVLVVRSTDPARAQAALRGFPDEDHVRVRRATWSLKELRATADRIMAAITAAGGHNVAAVVDPRSNRVLVRRPDTPQAASVVTHPAVEAALTEEGGRAAIPAPEPVQTVGHRMGESNAAPAATPPPPCQSLLCLPPMRGGLRLDIQRPDASWGACTTGFNLADLDGKYYILTAGHCVNNHEAGRSQHAGKPVAIMDPAFTIVEGTLDAAIMPYQSAQIEDYWTNHLDVGTNRVHVQCRPDTTNAGCRPRELQIQGVAEKHEIAEGWILCASGSATYFTGGQGWHPGTRCGTRIRDHQMALGFLNTDICARAGDSGGPLYDPTTSKAVGILKDGNNDLNHTNECQPPEENWYTWVDEILFHYAGRFQIAVI